MSARKLRPTGNRVLVLPDAPPKHSGGGITLPEHWQTPSNHGTVIGVGGDVADLTVGDRVIYSWINGREVEHDGQQCRLLDVAEIIALYQ